MAENGLDEQILKGLLDMLGKIEDKDAKMHGWGPKTYSTNEIISHVNERTELGLKYYEMYARHIGPEDEK